MNIFQRVPATFPRIPPTARTTALSAAPDRGSSPGAGQAPPSAELIRQGAIPGARRRLHCLPHRSRRQVVCRQAADADTVRHTLFIQHHARPGAWHREVVS